MTSLIIDQLSYDNFREGMHLKNPNSGMLYKILCVNKEEFILENLFTRQMVIMPKFWLEKFELIYDNKG